MHLNDQKPAEALSVPKCSFLQHQQPRTTKTLTLPSNDDKINIDLYSKQKTIHKNQKPSQKNYFKKDYLPPFSCKILLK